MSTNNAGDITVSETRQLLPNTHFAREWQTQQLAPQHRHIVATGDAVRQFPPLSNEGIVLLETFPAFAETYRALHGSRHLHDDAAPDSAALPAMRAVSFDRLPRKARVKTQAKVLGQAAALGAGLAVMNKVGDELLEFAARLAPQLPWITPMLEDPMGREVIKLVLAVAIHTAATQTDAIPKKEVVARVAEWQVTMSTMRVIAPQLDLFSDLVKSLVASGEKLPELEASFSGALGGSARVDDAELEPVATQARRSTAS